MSDPKPFDPFDPISAAMGAMHGQNLLAAKDARIKQLEAQVERLTKAGDLVATNIPRMVTCRVDADEATHLMEVWNAAKEGKQP
jgi:hypothetical protein